MTPIRPTVSPLPSFASRPYDPKITPRSDSPLEGSGGAMAALPQRERSAPKPESLIFP